MFRCCLDLVKFVLFIVNFAAFVVVGLALAGSIYTLIEPEKVIGIAVEPVINTSQPIKNSIYFILIVTAISLFGFLFLFTFLGCCGAACKNRCMLGSFIIFLMVFLAANVAGIIYIYVEYNNGEVDALKQELKKTIHYYQPDDVDSISRKFWDFIQPELKCCGAATIFDWKEDNRFLKAGRVVPASCCSPGADENCVYKPKYDNGAYMKGCVEKIELQFQTVFWGVPAFMALMLVFALIVCSKSGRDVNEYERAPTRHRGGGARSRTRSSRAEIGYEEDPANQWEFTPSYPTAPPYNPGAAATHQGGYGGGHRGGVEQYPTGQIPYNPMQQPLIGDQPPRYQDVAYQPYRDSGKIQYH